MKKDNKIQKYALLTVLFFVFLFSLTSVPEALSETIYNYETVLDGSTIDTTLSSGAGITATLNIAVNEQVGAESISIVFTNDLNFTLTGTVGGVYYPGATGTYTCFYDNSNGGVTVEFMTFDGTNNLVSGISTFQFQGTGQAVVIITGTASISAVPVPAAVWLLGSGLVGLFGVRRKMRS